MKPAFWEKSNFVIKSFLYSLQNLEAIDSKIFFGKFYRNPNECFLKSFDFDSTGVYLSTFDHSYLQFQFSYNFPKIYDWCMSRFSSSVDFIFF